MDKSKRHELRKHLKEKFGDDALTPSSMNEFMESQSRDLLFCLRCMNLVRGMNRDLGGSTTKRFIAFGSAASRGLKLSASNIVSPMSEVTKEEANLLTKSDSDDPRSCQRVYESASRFRAVCDGKERIRFIQS